MSLFYFIFFVLPLKNKSQKTKEKKNNVIFAGRHDDYLFSLLFRLCIFLKFPCPQPTLLFEFYPSILFVPYVHMYTCILFLHIYHLYIAQYRLYICSFNERNKQKQFFFLKCQKIIMENWNKNISVTDFIFFFFWHHQRK